MERKVSEGGGPLVGGGRERRREKGRVVLEVLVMVRE
jgi:hypothetical protein